MINPESVMPGKSVAGTATCWVTVPKIRVVGFPQPPEQCCLDLIP